MGLILYQKQSQKAKIIRHEFGDYLYIKFKLLFLEKKTVKTML